MRPTLMSKIYVPAALVAAVAFTWAARPLVGAGASAAADALDRLTDGNARFVAGVLADQPVDQARRAELVKGQAPYAIVLSCADSRVPPEIVFNTGLGELFVIRAAGEVADRSVIASIEYGAEHLHSPLLVVMGHDSCGAVKASMAATATLGPNLDYLVKAIRPAVDRTKTADAQAWLQAAIMANIEQVITDLLARSPIVAHAVRTGALQVVGGFYELESGRVRFSQPVPAAHRITHHDEEMK